MFWNNIINNISILFNHLFGERERETKNATTNNYKNKYNCDLNWSNMICSKLMQCYCWLFFSFFFYYRINTIYQIQYQSISVRSNIVIINRCKQLHNIYIIVYSIVANNNNIDHPSHIKQQDNCLQLITDVV